MSTDAFATLSTMLTGPLEIAPERVAPEATFGSLGLDSLAVEELQLLVLNTFGRELWADTPYDPTTTVAEAAAALQALSATA